MEKDPQSIGKEIEVIREEQKRKPPIVIIYTICFREDRGDIYVLEKDKGRSAMKSWQTHLLDQHILWETKKTALLLYLEDTIRAGYVIGEDTSELLDFSIYDIAMYCDLRSSNYRREIIKTFQMAISHIYNK